MITRKGLTSSLRHKITVENLVLTQDGAGGYTKRWQIVVILWASIVRKSAKEGLNGGKIAAENTCIFRVRYTNLINSDMRIKYDGRLFNIRAINNVEEQNMLLEILAEEGVAV